MEIIFAKNEDYICVYKNSDLDLHCYLKGKRKFATINICITMLYTYMKTQTDSRTSQSQSPVRYAQLGPNNENLIVVTDSENRYTMPEVVPFDIACWAMARGKEVFVENGIIDLTQDLIREYASEHRRYWKRTH